MVEIIGNGTLISRNRTEPFITDGAVVVDGSLICDFGKTAEMKSKYSSHVFTDADGGLIMPGLINTHTHIYSAFARGMVLSDGKESENFTQILENLWWRVDRSLSLEDIKYSALAVYLDSIKNGVTTVFDHHASGGNPSGSLFTIAEAAAQLGIRTSLCYEVSDRDGKEIAEAGIRENTDFIKYADSEKSGLLKGMFGLHASFTLSEETLEVCSEAGKDAGFHVHAAEGIADLQHSLKNYKKRVVERLNDAGILGDKSIAVHCIHINENEMDILKNNNTIVVNNPESNMGNAVGYSPIIRLMQKGITVGLGTDGYSTDMLESLKVANIISKHHLADPRAGWAEAPEALFLNNRKIAGRFFDKPLGIIEKGAFADIIVVDYNPHTPINKNNINSHLLFGVMGRNVVSTMVNGRFLMKEREILCADDKKIHSESRAVCEKFWKRV